MAYKQKYKGVSRKGKGFSISLSEKDIKSEKSASPEKAKEISYEGQGGIDYENLPKDAINPEGQGGIDYENDARFAKNPEGQGGKDYEADDSVAKMNSPLDKAESFGRSGHPRHMQAGADNSGNANAASADEYWRVHQQQRHHNSPKPKEKKKLKA